VSGSRESCEWRTIAEFPDYEVSEFGDVRRRVSSNYAAGRVLRSARSTGGYPFYNLWKNGKGANRTAHSLVARAFLGERPSPGHEVAHQDGDPGNSHRSNLRWATSTENNRDKISHGTIACGARNAAARLTEQDVMRIRERALFGAGVTETARSFGVCVATVKSILGRGGRRTWKHTPLY
jgi:hypothetical protein